MPQDRTPEEWKELDIKFKDGLQETHINQTDLGEYLDLKEHDQTEDQVTDHALWICCKEDFNGFTFETWNTLKTSARSRFRRYLLKSGVYVGKPARDYLLSQALQDAIHGEDMHMWTEQEVKALINEIPTSYITSITIQAILSDINQRQRPKTPVPPPPLGPLAPPGNGVFASFQQAPPLPPSGQSQGQSQGQFQGQPQGQAPFGQAPQGQTPVGQPQGQSGQSGQYQSQSKEPDHTKALSYMANAYTEAQKYNGSNGGFDYKLSIFYSIAKRTGVPPEAYALGLPIMLTGKALDYYFMNSLSGLSFEEACAGIKKGMEGLEFGRKTQNEWNLISLQSTMNISANASKTVLECFKLMTERMRQLRYMVKISDSAFANKLVEACRGVEACRIATSICNTAWDLNNLIDLFENSILSYESEHPRISAYTTSPTRQNVFGTPMPIGLSPEGGPTRNVFGTPIGPITQEYQGTLWSPNAPPNDLYAPPVSPTPEAYYTDRTYHRGGSRESRDPRGTRYPRYQSQNQGQGQYQRKRKCYVCQKENCISYNHTKDDIQKAKDQYRRQFNIKGIKGQDYKQRFRQYVMECEGHDIEDVDEEDDEDIISTFEAIAIRGNSPNSMALAPLEYQDAFSSYTTSLGSLTNEQARLVATELANRAFSHAIGQAQATDQSEAKIDPIDDPDVTNAASGALDATTNAPIYQDTGDPFTYTTTATRYSGQFVGIMIDTGASTKSTAGEGQFQALQKLDPKVQLDTSTKGQVKIQFGIGLASSVGSTDIDTPIGQVRFHVVKADTPFLLCLADMDRLQVHFNNITNMVISEDSKKTPVVRRFGHPFLLWNIALQHYILDISTPISSFLTDTELRRLHRRFGHPSANRLRTLLQKAGHEDIEDTAIEYLTKYCHQCQKHGASPGRFRFTLQDNEDIRFNYNIIVDIMYISGKPLLHVVDQATRYQNGRWLRDISAQHTWDMLKACWIDTYLGPPDWITTDAGKNFVSKDFKHYASQLGSRIKIVPVEAHNSIGMVERYHGPIRRAFQIIATEMPHLDPDMQLQMAFKAINDSVGPNGLIPTLLVYGAYPRISETDAPSPTVAHRANAIRKAMLAIQKLRAERQVAEALKMRNGPSTEAIHSLPPNSEVLVWREGNTGQSGHWDGPFNMISMEGEECIVDIKGGGTPIRFRSTIVKPYHQDGVGPTNQGWHDVRPTNDIGALGGDITRNRLSDVDPTNGITPLEEPPVEPPLEPQEEPPIEPPTRKRGRPRKYPLPEAPIKLPKRKRGRLRKYPLLTATTDISYISSKPSFEASRQKEINGLLEKGVFKVYNIKDIPPGVRLFNSRFVDDIKHQGTPNAYEKSRLVVQAYNDHEKELILTQSPTIQRVSQRLILCLASMLPDMDLYLRDISQAYVQSTTELNRPFYVRPPEELSNTLGIGDIVLKVVKPLYGIPEAGNHWFKTYHTHHIDQLDMAQSTFDPCLLYRNSNGGTNPGQSTFGIVGLQTDDTLFLANQSFASEEQEELRKARFMAKEREMLSPSTPIKFNGGLITQEPNGDILLTQKRQCEKITTVKSSISGNISPKEQYIAQRARGAYIASTCQPEASFDLSFAAQITDPMEEDIKRLNKRLQWQLDHQNRGLRFIKLDIESLQLLVFTDASFANNKDLSSQIGYLIVLSDGQKANILHWSSIKCKRVTRSVLASELYAMAHGYDISVAIKSTLDLILQHHRSGRPIPLVLCTDSKSLYDCIVRLGTTQEKRLMIDVMGLRQAYERKQISEVKWIAGGSNPADAMTKTSSKACDALERLISTNSIDLQAIGWVERTGTSGDITRDIKDENASALGVN